MNVVSLVLIVSCFTMLVTVVGISFAEVSSTTTRPMITFDKITYTWTDKVYMTILAPEYNLNSDTIDEIGNTVQNPIKISTGNHELDQYKLVETGPDTSIFTGYIILTGFEHDADGRTSTGDDNGYDTNPRIGDGNGRTVGLGPTNGFLENTNDDTISISFKFSEDETIIKSTPIKWNVGKAQWLQEFTSPSSHGRLRIIDPDMNINPVSIDSFEVEVWSTTDSSNYMYVKETGIATGIFEGIKFATINFFADSRLKISEGDIVTATYDDNTLPPPYDISDELYVEVTHIVVNREPLKRVPITDFRIINGAGGIVGEAASGNPIYIIIYMKNDQHKINQEFSYIVQIEDANNEVVHIDVKNHSLLSYEESSLSTSWMPDMPGIHTVTVFIWDSIDNPIPLSPKMERTILVTSTSPEN